MVGQHSDPFLDFDAELRGGFHRRFSIPVGSRDDARDQAFSLCASALMAALIHVCNRPKTGIWQELFCHKFANAPTV
jgi:hypothetical protein